MKTFNTIMRTIYGILAYACTAVVLNSFAPEDKVSETAFNLGSGVISTMVGFKAAEFYDKKFGSKVGDEEA